MSSGTDVLQWSKMVFTTPKRFLSIRNLYRITLVQIFIACGLIYKLFTILLFLVEEVLGCRTLEKNECIGELAPDVYFFFPLWPLLRTGYRLDHLY